MRIYCNITPANFISMGKKTFIPGKFCCTYAPFALKIQIVCRNYVSGPKYMRKYLIILALLYTINSYSQRVDTAYSNLFTRFQKNTNELVAVLNRKGITTAADFNRSRKNKKVLSYIKAIKKDNDELTSNKFSGQELFFYFIGNKSPRSQDLSSPAAQLQCSYSHFMATLKKIHADSLSRTIEAVLKLDLHLKKGYPPSIYCPYLYSEIKLGSGLRPKNK